MHPNESGQGYALRMAAENHLNGLPQLKALLGKSRYSTLDAVDTPLLQRWFGADAKELNHALGWTQTGQQNGNYVYAGQALGRSYFLNRSYPRICFQCLKAQGHCAAMWDFSLGTACALHQDVLSDVCPNCTRPISWNRPTPSVCNCHHEFFTHFAPEKATRLENQFAVWCEDRCTADRDPAREADPSIHQCIRAVPDACEPLVQLIWPLSLNGGMHVTYALATAAGYTGSIPQGGPRPRTPLEKARQILLKANELADMVSQLGELRLRVQRPSVIIQLLADCMSGGAPPADRHLAQSLLATVLHQQRKTRWSGNNPQLSQMLLF